MEEQLFPIHLNNVIHYMMIKEDITMTNLLINNCFLSCSLKSTFLIQMTIGRFLKDCRLMFPPHSKKSIIFRPLSIIISKYPSNHSYQDTYHPVLYIISKNFCLAACLLSYHPNHLIQLHFFLFLYISYMPAFSYWPI